MPPRQQTRENRRELREALLQDCRDGNLRPGDALPPLRELAARHGLSPATTQRVLKELSDEGILQIRQGSGAFLGHFPEQSELTFAAIGSGAWESSEHMKEVLGGFEAEIARRSGTAISLAPQTPGWPSFVECVRNERLKVGGAFFYSSMNAEAFPAAQLILRAAGDCPLVVYRGDGWPEGGPEPGRPYDTIAFDDEAGSRLAVQHLRRRGHRDIAFLALHTQDGTSSTDFFWSRSRENGFREVMREDGHEPIVFHPEHPSASSEHYDQVTVATENARRLLPLLREGRVKAVVCVNRFVLEGLVQAAREEALPPAVWPAIIAFDDASRDNHLLSVLKLPWDELGRLAAVNLWERAFGTEAERAAPPRQIRVPMRLIARPSGLERDHSLGHNFAAPSGRTLITASPLPS